MVQSSRIRNYNHQQRLTSYLLPPIYCNNDYNDKNNSPDNRSAINERRHKIFGLLIRCTMGRKILRTANGISNIYEKQASQLVLLIYDD